jgi:hypothetical protein
LSPLPGHAFLREEGDMPRTSPYVIELSDADQEALERLAARYSSPYRDVMRAKIVLYAALRLSN